MKIFPSYARKALKLLGVDARRSYPGSAYANPQTLAKASLFIERFREIVSDPLNILIERVPQAGYVDENGNVILHNGNRVPVTGRYAYYSDFSDILIINRGVHEPLEEYCFQETIKRLSTPAPIMIELGAYWCHYSMWLKKRNSGAVCYMVEPDNKNIEVGKNNFRINGYDGMFFNRFVSSNDFRIDQFVLEGDIGSIDVLHSDIQGYEFQMLQGAKGALSEKSIKYIFISTHSEDLHQSVLSYLKCYDYRIEVSSGFDHHTTSSDGFVFASSPNIEPVFREFAPMGRSDITKAAPADILGCIIAARESVI